MKKSKESSIQNGSTKYAIVNKFWMAEINIRTEILTHKKEENDFFEFCYKIQIKNLLRWSKLAQDVELRSTLLKFKSSLLKSQTK